MADRTVKARPDEIKIELMLDGETKEIFRLARGDFFIGSIHRIKKNGHWYATPRGSYSGVGQPSRESAIEYIKQKVPG
jgi:hypothetical protein